MLRRLFILVLIALCAVSGQAQTLTVRCWERPTKLDQPWINSSLGCLEEVIHDPEAGELAFTALAAAPDGTLYAARPLAGQVLALDDTDGDLLPDTPRVVAEGLTLPNGLVYMNDALYISGGSHVYRLQGETLETLIDDIPTGAGFWTGGVAVSGDGRIYVATGAPCDACTPEDEARGAILSYAADGSDRQLVVTGLRFPADLAFYGDQLYVVDSARDDLFDVPDLDEINRVTLGADFGFPRCFGVDNAPLSEGTDCAQTTPPVVTLPTASTPTGLTTYTSNALPMLADSLLVVLRGSYNETDLRGYALIGVRFNEEGAATFPVMPAQPQPGSALSDFTVEEMNYRGSGFYPHRPLDVTVTDQGWVYISVSGGRILALRPDVLQG